MTAVGIGVGAKSKNIQPPSKVLVMHELAVNYIPTRLFLLIHCSTRLLHGQSLYGIINGLGYITIVPMHTGIKSTYMYVDTGAVGIPNGPF